MVERCDATHNSCLELFTQCRGETVWKIAGRPLEGALLAPGGANRLLFAPSWRPYSPRFGTHSELPNSFSTHYGAYCWQQQVQVQEGGSMPTTDKRLLTDLRCRKHDHPFKAEIWQRLHYVAHSNEIVGKTTPKGALDNVRCPICGSPAKEP